MLGEGEEARGGGTAERDDRLESKPRAQVVLVFTQWPDSAFEMSSREEVQQQAREFFADLPLASAPEVFVMPAEEQEQSFPACYYTLEEERERLRQYIRQIQYSSIHPSHDCLSSLQRFWTQIQHASPLFLQAIES